MIAAYLQDEHEVRGKKKACHSFKSVTKKSSAVIHRKVEEKKLKVKAPYTNIFFRQNIC